jgi:hypothetical protein
MIEPQGSDEQQKKGRASRINTFPKVAAFARTIYKDFGSGDKPNYTRQVFEKHLKDVKELN